MQVQTTTEHPIDTSPNLIVSVYSSPTLVPVTSTGIDNTSSQCKDAKHSVFKV